MFIQVWLISLSIMISSCVHFPINVMILHFLYSYKKFLCVCMHACAKFSLLLNLLIILCAVTFTLQKTHARPVSWSLSSILKGCVLHQGLCSTLSWFLCDWERQVTSCSCTCTRHRFLLFSMLLDTGLLLHSLYYVLSTYINSEFIQGIYHKDMLFFVRVEMIIWLLFISLSMC